MRKLYLLLLTASAGLFAFSTALPVTPAPAIASAASAPLRDIAPAPRDALVDQLITGIMQRYHYAKPPLDDAFSEQVFKHYLQDLDPNKSYFLQSDVDSFAQYKDQMDDMIRSGKVQPAFDIYNLYQQRVSQRIQYAITLLDKEPDFTVDENYVFDREKAPWAKDTKELDDLWRRRVKNDAIGLLLAGKTWTETADTLRKRYQNFAYRIHQVNSQDVFALFMNSYVHTADPHTDYFPPSQSEEFQIQMSLKLQGIGASLTSEGEYTRIDHLLPGGPAARDPLKQLHPDDRITAVGQGNSGEMEDVVGWRLDDVVSKIRGAPGTVVRLQILPAGAAPGSPEKIVQLTRADVKLEAQAAHKKLITFSRDKRQYKIGVIVVPSFYEDVEGMQSHEKDYSSTSHDVKRLLGELKAEHVDGIIMDLRNNGGGSLKEAEDLTGLFVPEGPVVQIRDPNGAVQVDDESEDDGVVYSGPLTVLVNRFTASASEIFAAAIQDYHRGLVVGSVTYGKGTVQNLWDLDRWLPGDDDAGQLKMTINKFYRVTGSSTQNKGVIPDIVLPTGIDPTEFGESSNDSALAWDEIRSAQFTPLPTGLDKSTARLNALHQARAAADPVWKLFLETMADAQAERGKDSVSLVLAERQKQRAQDDSRRLALANAWRKLKGLPPAATLEEALKPVKDANDATDAGNDSGDDGLEPDVLLDESAQIVADMTLPGVFQAAPGSALADNASSAKPSKPH